MYILVQIVGRVLRSMQSQHGGAASIEDHSEYLLMALKEALALVGPIKCSWSMATSQSPFRAVFENCSQYQRRIESC